MFRCRCRIEDGAVHRCHNHSFMEASQTIPRFADGKLLLEGFGPRFRARISLLHVRPPLIGNWTATLRGGSNFLRYSVPISMDSETCKTSQLSIQAHFMHIS